MSDTSTPISVVRSSRRPLWVWLIPLAALIFVGVLVAMYVLKGGTLITLRGAEGHGIKAGDVVRCRGIVVGQVQEVRLAESLASVEIDVRLDEQAEQIARAGSRFWIVRPTVGLSGIAGLETIAGARYIAVVPASVPGAPQHQFATLDEPPVLTDRNAGGLEILLIAEARGGLLPGAAMMYRQMPIGRVLSVNLASDATSIEVRAYIEPAYAALVRDNSRFWNSSGARMNLGVTGLQVEVETLESLIVGGVALATPEPPGKPVNTGHRFRLHREAGADWMAWRPSLPVGADLLPQGTTPPALVRAVMRRSTGLLRRTEVRAGWLLPVEGGLLGPAALLVAGDDATATIELSGQAYGLRDAKVQRMDALALLPISMQSIEARPWPAARLRIMEEAEDLLLFTDSPARPTPLASPRVRPLGQGAWSIDPAISLPPDMQGAAAVSRVDGAVVGLVVMDQERARIVPVSVDQPMRTPAKAGAK